ncbi:hypothetical protein KDY119_03048 [Luteimicrobium xylanilyticum]|uniref:Uncharacterized protein n=1 Tax=Luteimicrobium xylanilyticum TaxID=1133546 RepID=A0A5P9QDR0_9MICO|nr:hypothetical protein [Luteimicrobium xylanilyticum]QFU99517.1 hypothetical protein KDY119_03048 [Luteimicrobium xylanilyticum]
MAAVVGVVLGLAEGGVVGPEVGELGRPVGEGRVVRRGAGRVGAAVGVGRAVVGRGEGVRVGVAEGVPDGVGVGVAVLVVDVGVAEGSEVAGAGSAAAGVRNDVVGLAAATGAPR